MKKNNWILIIGIIIIALLVFIAVKADNNVSNAPSASESTTEEVTDTTTNTPSGTTGSTSTNSNTSTKVSTAMPRPYITEKDVWPPAFEYAQADYKCIPSKSATESTVEKTIQGKKYCVMTVQEGSMGSYFYTYTYTTAAFGKPGIQKTRFAVQMQDCSIYIGAEQTKCRTAQSGFNLDGIIYTLTPR